MFPWYCFISSKVKKKSKWRQVTTTKWKTGKLRQGKTKKLLSHYCCLPTAPEKHFSKIVCRRHDWLLALSAWVLISSLPVSALLLHNRKHIMAGLKSIIPRGPDWITPPCSSFLTIVSCASACVCVCAFWAITAWPFLPPLLPIDCENRLGLIIHQKTVGVLTTPVAHGSKTRACVWMIMCVCVCICECLCVFVRININLWAFLFLKCIFHTNSDPPDPEATDATTFISFSVCPVFLLNTEQHIIQYERVPL